MLSDEVLERLTERVVNRIEEANTYTLKVIAKNIKKIGKLTPSDAQRIGQMLKYGGDYEKIINKLADVTKMNVKDIRKIFRELASREYKTAKQFYDYRKVKYIPFDENVRLQRQVDALYRTAEKDYLNLSRTSSLGFGTIDSVTGKTKFISLKQAYYDAIDKAVMSVSQGQDTFDNQMRKLIKEMGSGGLKVIYPTTYKDKNGNIRHYSRRLDSAVRTNLKDALRTLHNENQKLFGEEFRSDGVEISVHEQPAPDHEDVQGRQFNNKEFDKLQQGKKAKDVNEVEYTLDHDNKNGYRAIGTLNCYHYIFSIVLGISKPIYSDEQLEKIKERNKDGFEFRGQHYTLYQGTQLQRQIETEVRKAKDVQIMARESGQENVVKEAQENISHLSKMYQELANASKLPTKKKRMSVPNYRRVAIK